MKRYFLLLTLLAGLCAQAQISIPDWRMKDGPEPSADYTVQVKEPDAAAWQNVQVLACEVNLAHRTKASFAEFDMGSPVTVRVTNNRENVDKTVIRPLSKGVAARKINDNTVEFSLAKAEYLSVEFNGDRQHNLHLFANAPLSESHTPDEAGAIDWRGKNAQDVFVRNASLIYFAPGVHQPKDLPGGDIRIPSNCTVYLAQGAVVKARLIVDHAENVRIIGHGIIDHPLRGVEITFSKNVTVDGLTFLNPQHYTVFGGQSDSITIRNIKSFSARSWSDGIDLMCCSNVKIEHVFLRTSDDCLALYNHRWWYWGGSSHFDVSDATLWPDVAHPVNIGSHGDDRSATGETLHDVRIHDCDILYAKTNSALNFSCGDKNHIRNVTLDDIRIEEMDSTALIGMRVVYGATYNRAPGNSIRDVRFRNIQYLGDAGQLKPSFIRNYDERHGVSDISIENVTVNGKPFTKNDMDIGQGVKNITVVAQSKVRQLVVNAKDKKKVIQPTMYGIFFEDINYGADGGLNAEMVKNRSFEFPAPLGGWDAFGKVSVEDRNPAFERNPHYAVLEDVGHYEKRTGLVNHGLFGMGFKQDSLYVFSMYARLHQPESLNAGIEVDLVDSHNNIIGMGNVVVNTKDWFRYTISIKAAATEARGGLHLVLNSKAGIDADHVSLMPADNWNGMRTDLVRALEDLHPGVFRFPGGCIVEGTDLATRYQWKNTVGAVENRPLNENRWNSTFAHRLSPDYYQSAGIGFYEYFLLSEKTGAAPLPILNCGMACQYQNKDDDPKGHVPVDSLQQYIQDALDLIEFANGDATTEWGHLRAAMGHPAPFGLQQIGIGNEQWGRLYEEHLVPFVKAIRAKYPDMKIVGSAGPSPDGKDFDFGWEAMRRVNADLVDEHYYKSPDWFLKNAGRYDNYDRHGPKVFAGEYACHTKNKGNNFEAALCEAAFMTGLERNADVVWQTTYAPLFAHVDGWQWKPNLIWFDNLRSLRTVNYYVQQLYAANKGTNVVTLTENGKPVEGQDSLYASAVYDKVRNGYIVKVVNVSGRSLPLSIVLKGAKAVNGGEQTTLHADELKAENTLDNPFRIEPKTRPLLIKGNRIDTDVAPGTFALYKFY